MGAALPAKSIPVFAQIEVQLLLSLKLIVWGLVLTKDVTAEKIFQYSKALCLQVQRHPFGFFLLQALLVQ